MAALVAAELALLVYSALYSLPVRVPPLDGLRDRAFDLGITLRRWALKELKTGR